MNDVGPPADSFVEVIAREVEADPGNLALREDFITLLLEQNPSRAATELKAFESLGGDPARVRLLRARLMAARMRASNPPPPAAPPSTLQTGRSGQREPKPVPAPADDDRQAGSAAGSASLWDAERPAVTLADVAGLAEVKRHLDTAFLAPLRNPELAAAFGQKPGGSLLMYGPPGCGKTFIARAIAGDLGASFIHVTLADLLGKWIGESEKAIQSVFRNARAAAPCVIFFDEFDALGGRRTSGGGGSQTMRMLVTQLLEELDGVAGANEGVYFLAATNRPWDVDGALRRPGRIDKTVLVLPPDAVARAAIVRGALKGKPADAVDVVAIAAATEGFSGADLSHLVTTVLQEAMVESMSRGELVPVTTDAMLAAVGGVTPSTASWFDQVAPVLEYGVDDGTFDQLRAYRVRWGMR
ncbi:ATPase family protein associated with various cellular activities (AAA) [Saccharothrix carnea]|uniref:ATPase family protein associated with various cellular activities (AAA) n=1 Tax=Saccharothrix carnea TaxID=1280637 RepID=A0A2P8IEY4_SACCR|nr:ATP-binding protein [Saccharothrix carnea]PSL57039.1 ATPase family protein associated with various cellular activities (AAA) [Saccharothrix carnea]